MKNPREQSKSMSVAHQGILPKSFAWLVGGVSVLSIIIPSCQDVSLAKDSKVYWCGGIDRALRRNQVNTGTVSGSPLTVGIKHALVRVSRPPISRVFGDSSNPKRTPCRVTLEIPATSYFERLADAIYKAEGVNSRHPYGILSVKVKSKEEARQVCLRVIKFRYWEWANRSEHQASPKSMGIPFLSYLRDSYCPLNAKNDPMGLNFNWKHNVEAVFRQ